MEPIITATLVDNSEDDLEGVHELLRQQAQELEQIRWQVQNAAVAEVVPNDIESPPHQFYRGQDTSDNPKPCSSYMNSGRKKCIFSIAVVAIIIVGIVVGVVVASNNGQPIQQTQSPPTTTSQDTEQVTQTPPPTTPQYTEQDTQQTLSLPTQSPPAQSTMSPSLQSLTELLSSVSLDGGTALQTPLTPQYNALNWLAGNANLDSYSNERKIQRYVLATLYYSTNGDAWKNNTGWLGDGDECEWWHDAEGQFCVDGAVVELDLYSNNLIRTIPVELALLSNSVGKCLPISKLMHFHFYPSLTCMDKHLCFYFDRGSNVPPK